MRLRKTPFLLILVTLFKINFIYGQQLITYPDIPGRNPSDKYECRVREVCSNTWRDAFVAQTTSQAPTQTGNGYISHLQDWSASWTSFEFDGIEIVVEISKADGSPIQTAMVRPEGSASPAFIENGKAYVTFSSHANINVDIDGQLENQYTGMFYSGNPVHTISVFGNPIFHVPDTTNSSVYYLHTGDNIPSDLSTWDTIYFAPGIHHIGTPYQINSNKTLFIPGNAIVHGTIHPPNTWGESTSHDWSVYGSGAISGEEIPHWSVGTLDGTFSKTFTHQAKSVHLEGFVVVDPAHHTFNMQTSDFTDTTKANVYKNLKILAWRLNSDGLNAFSNSIVTDCFFRCQDDLFYYGGDHVKISNCVTWTDYNGSVVKVHGGSSQAGFSYFKNIRCIYHRAGWHYWDGGRVVSVGYDAGGSYNHVLISNILVEDPHPSLPPFRFNISNNNNTTTPTSFNNVVIEKVIQVNAGEPNAWGDGTFGAPQNQFFGSDSAGMFSNIVFKNCYYNGSWLGNFNDGNFATNDFVRNIQFDLDDTLSISPPAYTGSTNGFMAPLPPTPTISGGNPINLCAGNSVTLTSSSEINNSWSTGSNNPSIEVEQAGDYYVTVSNGTCSASSAPTTVNVLIVQETIIQPQNQTVNISDSASFYTTLNDINASYQWQSDNGFGFQNLSNGGQISGATGDTLTIYNVSLSNNNQQFRSVVNWGICADTSNTAILSVNNITMVPEANDQSVLSIFPIPSNRLIQVECKNGYQIYSSTGALVKESRQPATQIDISKLPAGLYYINADKRFGKFMKIE